MFSLQALTFSLRHTQHNGSFEIGATSEPQIVHRAAGDFFAARAGEGLGFFDFGTALSVGFCITTFQWIRFSGDVLPRHARGGSPRGIAPTIGSLGEPATRIRGEPAPKPIATRPFSRLAYLYRTGRFGIQKQSRDG